MLSLRLPLCLTSKAYLGDSEAFSRHGVPGYRLGVRGTETERLEIMTLTSTYQAPTVYSVPLLRANL